MLTTIQTPRLTAADRCDKCHVAQATHVVTKDDMSIIFCEHHVNEHGPSLTASGWEIQKAHLNK